MRQVQLFGLLLSSLLLISSCGTDEGFTGTPPTPTAFLIIVNAIPDSPELTVNSKNVFVSRVQYGRASAVKSVLPQIAVDYDVEFLNAEGVQTTLISKTENIDINNTHIIILSGTMANPVVNTVKSTVNALDSSATNSKAIFINASTQFTNVNMIITDPSANSQTINLTANTPPTSLSVATGNSSRINIIDPATSNLLWDSGDFNFTVVTERLIVLVDYFGPGAEKVRMFSVSEQIEPGLFFDEQLQSQIRYLNVTPDRGALDILANTEKFAANLNFGDLTAYENISNNVFTFNVTTADDPSDVLSSVNRAILPGKFYTFGASGLADTNSSTLAVEDRRAVPLRAVLNVTKLAPSSGLIDIYLLEPGTGVKGFPLASSLPDFSPITIDLLPKSYDLVVTGPSQTNILYGPETITLNGNGIYGIVLTDTEGGGAPIQVKFLDDFTN